MSDVVIGLDRGVQTLRLARLDKKNALTQSMYKALSDALEASDASSTVAVNVILGAPGVFCAGNDIADFLSHGMGSAGATSETLRFIRLLPRLAKPMIAGVDGLAIGIGTTLLFHCDLVYATPASTFATPFLDLGLVPEAASSMTVPQRLGYARAFELLVLGETFTAERMREAGLVNALVPADKLEAAVGDAARRLARKPPEAVAIARKLLRGDTGPISRRTDEEAEAFAGRLSSPEAREAFQAFLEKRPAKFTGPGS